MAEKRDAMVSTFIVEDSAKYEGLNIKEKARRVVYEMGETGQIMKVAWAMEIEKALCAMFLDWMKLRREKRDEVVREYLKLKEGKADD